MNLEIIIENTKVGDRFQHFRNTEVYEFQGFARNCDHPDEIVVIYQNINKKTDPWYRSMFEFFGTVEVDGEQVFRFKKV